jgi:CopG family nickel-responsive transcriptional regulator
MHVHLDHERCLEVIVMKGTAAELQDVGEKLFGTRGVTHGGIEVVTARSTPAKATKRTKHEHGAAPRRRAKKKDHDHGA